jgi:hypothetical protein
VLQFWLDREQEKRKVSDEADVAGLVAKSYQYGEEDVKDENNQYPHTYSVLRCLLVRTL